MNANPIPRWILQRSLQRIVLSIMAAAIGASAAAQDIVLPDDADIAAMKKKAGSIVIPKLVFEGTSVRDCLAFLAKKSHELDPEKVGIRFVLKLDFDSPSRVKGIALNEQNIPLFKAVEQVAAQAELGVEVGADSIALIPVNELNALINKEYDLPSGLLMAAGAGPDPTKSMSDFLDDLWMTEGVQFPEGAIAVFNAPRKLSVRNTPANHKAIVALIENFRTKKQTTLSAPLVAIATKLKTIVLPKLEFEEMDVRQCAAHLEAMSRELDSEKKGIKIALKARKEALQASLTINVQNVPLREALKLVTALADLDFRINEEGVVIIDPPGGSTRGPSDLPPFPFDPPNDTPIRRQDGSK
jgi:hypothetical protein